MSTDANNQTAGREAKKDACERRRNRRRSRAEHSSEATHPEDLINQRQRPGAKHENVQHPPKRAKTAGGIFRSRTVGWELDVVADRMHVSLRSFSRVDKIQGSILTLGEQRGYLQEGSFYNP